MVVSSESPKMVTCLSVHGMTAVNFGNATSMTSATDALIQKEITNTLQLVHSHIILDAGGPEIFRNTNLAVVQVDAEQKERDIQVNSGPAKAVKEVVANTDVEVSTVNLVPLRLHRQPQQFYFQCYMLCGEQYVLMINHFLTYLYQRR